MGTLHPRETSDADQDLVGRLRDKAVAVLGSIIPRSRPVALLDFPRYANIGDSAIWLGEIRALEQCGVRTRDLGYMCDLTTYNRDRLRRTIGPDGVILLHGGGNFGDLWARHQLFRESVIAAFPGNQIVILPQSIYFREQSALFGAARVFNSHRKLTILARDRRSLDLLRKHFNAESHLCPDMAFCLGPLARTKADRDLVYLARNDLESKFDDGSVTVSNPLELASCDWPEIGNAWQWRAGDIIAQVTADHPRMVRRLNAQFMVATRISYNAMARERLRTGCKLLARGKVVIADRLHAHILALLMGIPHVVLDNKYGKIHGFRDAWTAESRIARVAHSREEALEAAQAMLRAEA